ncbi:hypothetical protein EAH_00029600 [Eimeria acervulina]|uniref:Uncharacterized protein n=1 Tax=Eimeria acervulina TaxID=5801 RepID=U6GVS4_EIMAC|nr:hypothetical protein EAH_00029600 [Eimeria acervulina]CDI82644.1 hypothetical protein EAH_00029600 [Eimeria acervulina]
MHTDKALLIVDLREDGAALKEVFEGLGSLLETIPVLLQWAATPGVSAELLLLLSRMQAVVLLNAPMAIATRVMLLQQLLQLVAAVAAGTIDAAAAAAQIQTNAATHADCACKSQHLPLPAAAAAAAPAVTPTAGAIKGISEAEAAASIQPAAEACDGLAAAAAAVSQAAAAAAGGLSSPEVYITPVGDVYYLKQFIYPSNLPSVYLRQSELSIEGSQQQQQLQHFLSKCLPAAIDANLLRYSKPQH